jgi:PPOX class probable F420-dependent enzyme
MAQETGQSVDQFTHQSFINLETTRKNGKAVQTPVWFIELGGVLYVRTGADSGKVKRIRNNGSVRVAPCDYRGKPGGDWVEARARLVDSSTAEQVNQLFNRKYGIQKRGFDLMGLFSSSKMVTIALEMK